MHKGKCCGCKSIFTIKNHEEKDVAKISVTKFKGCMRNAVEFKITDPSKSVGGHPDEIIGKMEQIRSPPPMDSQCYMKMTLDQPMDSQTKALILVGAYFAVRLFSISKN